MHYDRATLRTPGTCWRVPQASSRARRPYRRTRGSVSVIQAFSLSCCASLRRHAPPS
jgi:hypothetical protein